MSKMCAAITQNANGLQNKLEDKNKELLKEKQKKLQQQFKEISKNVATKDDTNKEAATEITEHNNYFNPKEIIKKYRKENKSLTNENINITGKFKNAQQEIQTLNEKSRQDKSTIFELNRKYKDLELENKNVLQKYGILSNQFKELEIQFNELSNHSIEEQIQEYEKTIRKLEKQIIEYCEENKKLINRLQTSENTVSNLRALKYDSELNKAKEKNLILTREVNNLLKKNEELNESYLKLKEVNQTLQGILYNKNPINKLRIIKNKLLNYLSFVWLIQKYKKYVNNKIVQYNEKLKDETINIHYGFIALNNNEQYIFKSISGEEFLIISTLTKKLSPDSPAKANIVNSEAKILKTYEDKDKLQTKDGVENYKKLNKLKLIYEDLYKHNEVFNNFTILIVGSRNKVQYTRILSKVGFNVTWFNPFEESENRLKDKIKYADVVIVCTRHISHSVLDIVDLHHRKTQLIKRDNNETILARVRYALVCMNLI